MSIEQRLVEAFRSADVVRPSDDLWSRVVHSIEEDRAHRRRVAAAIASVSATVVTLVAVGVAFRRENAIGHYVHRPVFGVLETTALIAVVVVLGPAIRRFGRGYSDDLWPNASIVSTSIVRLMDVAYALVFTGYILVTTRFDHPALDTELWTDQVGDAAIRLGGLLLIMGVLHALTFIVLPVVAIVHNTTRRGRRLPRWLTVVGVVWLVLQVVPAFPALVILLVGLAN